MSDAVLVAAISAISAVLSIVINGVMNRLQVTPKIVETQKAVEQVHQVVNSSAKELAEKNAEVASKSESANKILTDKIIALEAKLDVTKTPVVVPVDPVATMMQKFEDRMLALEAKIDASKAAGTP